jgi:hypothetical protein
MEDFNYKPCCDKRCLLVNCETRNKGGCYCVCALVDAESTLTKLLDGTFSSIAIPLSGEERQKFELQLKSVTEKIEKYKE